MTYEQALGKMRKLHAGIVKKISARHANAGLQLKAVIEEGPSAEVIVKAARKAKAELIVIGTHSRSRFASFLMGCVATKVVRDAETSVLMVKDRKHRLGLLAALARL